MGFMRHSRNDPGFSDWAVSSRRHPRRPGGCDARAISGRAEKADRKRNIAIPSPTFSAPASLVQGKFEPDRRVGGLLAAGSTTLSITPAGFEGYAKMADSVARQVVDEKNRAQTDFLHAEIRQRAGPRLRRPDHRADMACCCSAGR